MIIKNMKRKIESKKRGIFSNKKGNISITILVIGVFAISSFAILSFIISDFDYGNSFVGVSVMQKINAGIDEYKFYQKVGVPIEKIDAEFDMISEGGIDYLYYEKKNSGWLDNKEELLFSVQYPLRKSS